MFWTDNPRADAARYDRMLCRYWARKPRCQSCGEPLGDYGFRAGGRLFCPDCQKEAWDAVKWSYLEVIS